MKTDLMILNLTRFLCRLTLMGVCLIGGFESSAQTPAQTAFFEKRIRPLLAKNCYGCHSSKDKKFKGGLALDTKALTLRGGDSGPAIVARKPSQSLLIEAVLRKGVLKMPPKKRLSKTDVALLRKWITMGAPDPRDREPVREVASTIDVEKGREFWAFQLPAIQPSPSVRQADWPRTEIDHRVLAKLEEHELVPNADADKRALLRRAYFDLIGLPPTPAQLAAFLKDGSRHAFEKVVDQLLKSPRYGERWGRHWLDIARYAESNGMERNQLYPHAWRYRDYVIASFNADKPFDRFLHEQIAGDQLAADSDYERDQLTIATGFLALGPKSLNERDKRQFQMDVVDEQIDLVTRSTMALTVSCARCHDHKFDPIATADYYSMAGIFKSTATKFNFGATAGVRQQSGLLRLSKSANESAGVTYAKARAPKGKSKKKKKGKSSKLPTGPMAMGVEDGNVADCPIHIRGDVAQTGRTVPRGIPAVMALGDVPKMKPDSSGRRELAQWLTSPANPLTARVFVNRAWHYLFGRGIVRTTDNFGETGARPSNLELLDHLALKFITDGWSVKRLVKTIVMSRSYQMASTPNPANRQIDPENSFYWKANHRRLDAESIRDAMLSVSGTLELEPPTGSIVAPFGENQIDRNAKGLQALKSERPYRSAYLPIVRNNVSDVLTLFDFAEPSMIVGSRNVTTVPSQALFLLNSKFVLAQSREFANTTLEDSSLTGRERIQHIYRHALLRKPVTSELQRALAFIQACTAENQSEADAWAGLCQAVFGSGEFRYLN
jgi:hypothetical protein